ncbi:MAG: hypothetical protein J5850_04225 [Clostridia bacterium]|nr:hypothetical protein [Clostridia bacterium]
MSILNRLFSKAGAELRAATSKAVSKAMQKTETFKFEKLPETLDEFKALSEAKLDTPFAAAALTIVALEAFETSGEEACYEMLQFVKGPGTLSNLEKQQIKFKFGDQPFLARSYFVGSTPKNNYTPEKPYTIKISTNPYSYETKNEGYVNLWVQSGGADSPRQIQLRNKPSTNQWFMNQQFLMSDIRIPVEQDAWA